MQKLEQLVESNKGLVYKLAHKYKGRGTEFDDLVQEGFLGLMNAVNNYNGTGKFSTYAYTVIRYYMLDALNNNNVVNLTRHDRTMLKGVDRLMREGKTLQEACEELKYNESIITYLIDRKPVRIDLETSAGGCGIDLLGDNSLNPDELVAVEMKEKALSDFLDEVLTERDVEIVKLRHGFTDNKIFTFKEIGNMFDITDEGARKAFNSAMKILRQNKDEVIKIWQ